MDQNAPSLRFALQVAAGVTALGALMVGFFLGWSAVLGWTAGAVWNLLNVVLLKNLAFGLAEPLKQVRWRMIRILLVKFAGLYPAGFFILWSGWVPPMAFAMGFTAVLMTLSVVFILPRSTKECRA